MSLFLIERRKQMLSLSKKQTEAIRSLWKIDLLFLRVIHFKFVLFTLHAFPLFMPETKEQIALHLLFSLKVKEGFAPAALKKKSGRSDLLSSHFTKLVQNAFRSD